MRVVGVVDLVGNEALVILKDGYIAAGLHLDNILALNDIATLGLEERSRRSTLRRSSECQGKSGNNSSRTHLGGFDLKIWT
ncbi:hypothetical protein RRF57_007472 [Xylaria bambusicola]|uniref:Uncharacterized protein n=1 Tax=Xylaria bambusicola TaxID=326684 RepID=A0AAN7Z6B7_9PEZI